MPVAMGPYPSMFIPFVACAAGTRVSEQRRRNEKMLTADLCANFIENPPFFFATV
jgi:hypothetical protein